ncbi:hypothetical protein RA272_28430, partial [Pseudomonas syringae pv. tagetis]|uniref:hypothetical protein n=1 Tax=Pseudomonas syringae group genomosp. 7 TaxID=251699 RepID=UPI0037702CA9
MLRVVGFCECGGLGIVVVWVVDGVVVVFVGCWCGCGCLCVVCLVLLGGGGWVGCCGGWLAILGSGYS